jgi:acetyl-CoA acetyltransferase
VLAEVAHALDRARLEPGWVGVVAGADLRAELLLAMSGNAGARHLIAVRDANAPEPRVAPDLLLRGRVSDYQAQLVEALESIGAPVVAFSTASDSQVVHALLSALPASSRLVLLAGDSNGSTQVNFYSDVHRKNVMVAGVDANSFGHQDVIRAQRLLQHSRVRAEMLDVPEIAVGPDAQSLNFSGR